MGYFGKRPTDDLAAQSEMNKDNPKDLIIFGCGAQNKSGKVAVN